MDREQVARELLKMARSLFSDIEKVTDGVAKGQTIEMNPTQEQIDSENYKKGHVTIGGLEISIENPLNSTRSGVGPDGEEWSQTMKDDYGYVKGSRGRDKDHVDVFINPELPKGYDTVYVVNQVNDDGGFDEHKCMIGYPSEAKAKQAYLRNYEKGWQGCGSIVEMDWADFKDWIFSDDPKKGELKESSVMDKQKVARELVSIAKELTRDRVAMLDYNVYAKGGNRGATIMVSSNVSFMANSASEIGLMLSHFESDVIRDLQKPIASIPGVKVTGSSEPRLGTDPGTMSMGFDLAYRREAAPAEIEQVLKSIKKIRNLTVRLD